MKTSFSRPLRSRGVAVPFGDPLDRAAAERQRLEMSFRNLSRLVCRTKGATYALLQSLFRIGTALGVGVFNDPFFAKDVAPNIFLYKDPVSKMAMDKTHTITSSGEDYYMDLEVGHVISFSWTQPDDDFTFRITGPLGETINP
jgi:hypothetical protein